MNFSLIIELAKRDFIERYSGSALGFSWSFIYPLINILIYMVIFGSLMGSRLPGDSSVWSYSLPRCRSCSLDCICKYRYEVFDSFPR